MKENDIIENPYSIESVIYEFDRDVDLLDECIDKCHYSRNYEKINKYIDIFIKYLFDIIDESKKFRINPDAVNKYVKEYQKLKKCDDYFIIDDEDSKNILKDNIIFNINYNSWECTMIPTDNKHIANDRELFFVDVIYSFYKGDECLINLYASNGLICDYRDLDVIEKQQNKYRELSKNIM